MVVPNRNNMWCDCGFFPLPPSLLRGAPALSFPSASDVAVRLHVADVHVFSPTPVVDVWIRERRGGAISRNNRIKYKNSIKHAFASRGTEKKKKRRVVADDEREFKYARGRYSLRQQSAVASLFLALRILQATHSPLDDEHLRTFDDFSLADSPLLCLPPPPATHTKTRTHTPQKHKRVDGLSDSRQQKNKNKNIIRTRKGKPPPPALTPPTARS